MHIRDTRKLGQEPASSEITPEAVFRDHSQTRRRFLTGAAYTGAAVAVGALASRSVPGLWPPSDVHAAETPLKVVPSKYTVDGPQTPQVKATHYNNFYEFGTNKGDPAENAHTLQTRPWVVQVDGLVKKPLSVNIDDLIAYRPLESRVYRFRCVEAWSMVIPWDGYPLSDFINFCQPLPSAKYVKFVSDFNKQQMPDRSGGIDWPYTEGLRMDEAMNPLTLLTFGAYGGILPNQSGAPVRIVVPWKYGFKGGKSIVKVEFIEKQPETTWHELGPDEYGFYSNVNPNVDHPRWSQAHERRIDTSAFPHTIPTEMFNGYGDQVAGMYAGMDLRKYF